MSAGAGGAAPTGGEGPAASPADALCDILRASLTALAGAGQADLACRLAGRTCAVLRQQHPRQWGKFNALLHGLAPLTGDAPPGGG